MNFTHKLDEIAALWTQKLPASKIASQLGMSKGTVCGLVFRARRDGDLRFPQRPPPFAPRPRRKREKPMQVAFVPDLSHLVKAPPRARFGAVPLLDLRPHECRYPTQTLGSRGEFLFCGKPKSARSESYCEEHYDLCLAPPFRKKAA